MHDLFISYAREDEIWVERFYQMLDGEGLKVWKDSAIPTGKPYGRVIEEAIAAARAVVVIWSQAAVASDWVRAEATEGLRRGVLMPVRRDESLPPMRFRTIQTVDLTDWAFEPEHPAYRRLVGDLKILVQQAAPSPANLEVNRGEQGRRSKTLGKGRIWALAGMLLALAAAGAAWLWYEERGSTRLSVELTAASRTTLDEVADKYRASRLYWHYFLDRQQGQRLIERSVLLALEAVRIKPTAEAIAQLRQSLVLLPRPLQKFGDGQIRGEAEISPNGNWVAWSGQRGIKLMDSRNPTVVRDLAWQGSVSGLLFSSDGGRLIALGDDGALKIRQLGSGKDSMLSSGEDVRVLDYALDASGSRIALRQASLLSLRELPSGKLIGQLAIEGNVQPGLRQTLDISADGRTVAFSAGRELVVWDVDKRETRFKLEFESQLVELSFDPTGAYLLALSADGEARLIDPTDAEVAINFSVDAGTRLVSFSSAGDRLALASAGRVRVVAVSDPVTAILDYAHADTVTRIEFNMHDNLIASAGRDGMVRVWDLETKTELIRFGFRDLVLALRFYEDGKSLMAIDRRGQLSIWPVWYADPASEACRVLQRNLTPEEWRRYLTGENYHNSCDLAR